MSKIFKDKKEYYSLRKFKGVGLASALVGLAFLSPNVLAEEVVTVTADNVLQTESVHTETSSTSTKETINGNLANVLDNSTENTNIEVGNSKNPVSIDKDSITVTDAAENKPNEKQLNRTNNYNPKWDSVDENGNIIRDLNKYSDPNFSKGYGESFDVEGNRVENNESSSDKKPDSDTVVETSKPVDESKFEFKTTWEDGSVEDKSGIYNPTSNSLIGTYSGTEVAKKYVCYYEIT